MLISEIIKSAYPSATPQQVEHIAFYRTSYPGDVSAKDAYKAANTYRRAVSNNRRLCYFCDREIPRGRIKCSSCKI